MFSHHSCFSQRTGTYVLSLIKVGFYSPPTEVMNSYLCLTHMKHKPLAGLRGFLGWKMIDRWWTAERSEWWPWSLRNAAWPCMYGLGRDKSGSRLVIRFYRIKQVVLQLNPVKIVLVYNCNMFIGKQHPPLSVAWQQGTFNYPNTTLKVFCILSFHHHLFSFTYQAESLCQQTVHLGNESWSLSGLVISKSLL